MRKGVISTMFHDICRPSLPRKRLASSIGLERETFITRVISRLRVRVPRWAFLLFTGFLHDVLFISSLDQDRFDFIQKVLFLFLFIFFLVLRCGRVIGALKRVIKYITNLLPDQWIQKTKTPKKFYNKDRNKVHFNSSILLSALPFQLLCSFKK